MILPDPGKDFEWRETPQGLALVCRPLEALTSHVFTTKSWALGRGGDGDPAAWPEVASAVGCPAPRLRRARQVHGAAVVHAAAGGAAPDRLSEGDIVIADATDVAVAVQVADCVPLLVVDAGTGAAAAAHAGWRGLALNVPGATVAALSASFGSRPQDLVAAVGPSIGACCYEVGADVHAALSAACPSSADADGWFRTTPAMSERNPSRAGGETVGRPDRWYLDCWRTTRDQLRAAGIPGGQIFTAGLCTASHPELFCSYRRDGLRAGRLAAAVRPFSRRP